jgi:hypothetical protein
MNGRWCVPRWKELKPSEEVTFIPQSPFNGAKKEVIQFWFEPARTMTRRLIESWPDDANTELKHVAGLEAMNSPEWLEGYGGHEAFHHKQINRVISQLQEHNIK